MGFLCSLQWFWWLVFHVGVFVSWVFFSVLFSCWCLCLLGFFYRLAYTEVSVSCFFFTLYQFSFSCFSVSFAFMPLVMIPNLLLHCFGFSLFCSCRIFSSFLFLNNLDIHVLWYFLCFSIPLCYVWYLDSVYNAKSKWLQFPTRDFYCCALYPFFNFLLSHILLSPVISWKLLTFR